MAVGCTQQCCRRCACSSSSWEEWYFTECALGEHLLAGKSSGLIPWRHGQQRRPPAEQLSEPGQACTWPHSPPPLPPGQGPASSGQPSRQPVSAAVALSNTCHSSWNGDCQRLTLGQGLASSGQPSQPPKATVSVSPSSQFICDCPLNVGSQHL